MTTKANLIKAIASVAKSEANVRVKLAELSRDLLTYICVDNSNDIDTVNRLLGVLTPRNRETCEYYFSEFLPFKFDKKAGSFGKKLKGNDKVEGKVAAAAEFLEDEENNVWTWAKANLKTEKKPVDYRKKIVDDIKKALDPEKGGMSQDDVLTAALEGGLDVDTVIALLRHLAEDGQRQAA